MARSALGDPLLYDELSRDPGAIRQAVFVVLLVSVIHGLAASFATLFGETDRTGASLFLSSAIFTGLGWTLSALFSYMIVSLIAGTSATGFTGGTFLQFIRSAGFTASPAVLLILAPLPVVGGAAVLASVLWITTAMIIATRESLSCSIGLAAVAVVVGTLVGRIITGLTLVLALSPAT